MKAPKALKRLTHAEDLISDVLERYLPGAPEIGQQLLDAKAAIGRAKANLTQQASSRPASAAREAAAAKKAAVPKPKVPPARAAKKHQKGKRDYDED